MIKILTFTLILFFGLNSFADLSRKERQARRINNGVATGELNQAEADRLRAEQAAIIAKRKELKSDGNFTDADRATVQGLRDTASKNIFEEKHDKQVVDDSLGERRRNQHERIQNGVDSGQLTEDEAAALREENREYRFLQRKLGTDEDGLTAEDVERLDKKRDNISKKIRKEKHDAQVAQ